MNPRIIFAVLLGHLTLTPIYAVENNIHISGKLVTEPCTLSPESADIPLDFGNVVGKYFQTAARTPGMVFSIKLVDCDTSMGNSATVTFLGAESGPLPGLLVTNDGEENGLAFGIETLPDSDMEAPSQLIPINKPSPLFLLSNSESEIKLQGYIEAEPNAIETNTIKSGPFSVTATFKVDYP
ncbi:type 1 fimbrial protein [Citrobacter braakii]